ncbi:MAG: GerMN domain-containing protein [Actinomycetota bacterium]|nr:GerMN domain-containing protein [Actinomycetota bacterium]
MNYRNSNPKYRQSNKKRGPSPILKFSLILALVFIVGFFIFYIIDNPDFLKEKISPVRQGDEDSGSGGEIASGPEDNRESMEASGMQTAVTENEESLEISGENIGQSEDGSDGESGNESESGGETEILDESEAADILGSSSDDIAKDGNISSSRISDAVTSSEGNQIENENSNGENGDNNTGDAGKSLSFWQKIMNFITRSGDGDNDKEEDTYPSSLKINFYFSALGEDKKLVSEERTINAGSPAIAAQNAIAELLKGPTKPHHFPVIPAGTKLLGVEVSENIAKVDFSQEFLENSLDTSILDEYIIYSIVNTLTEIPDIEGVIFYIEGIRINVYGNVDLSIPAIRNKDFIEEEEE